MPYRMEVPDYGKPKLQNVVLRQSPEITQEVQDLIWDDGQEQVMFKTNFLLMDYNVTSTDMQNVIKSLRKQKNEEVFKTQMVNKLLDYLWKQTRRILEITFATFSIFMIIFSVYVCLEDPSLAYEVCILVFTGILVWAEILQMLHLKENYFSDLWNWLDVTHLCLTSAFIITRILQDENELARAWISSILILMGYLRWVSYLRLFKPTRNLIQVIITIINDMKSFIIIIALIIIGFSFIFLVFDRGHDYGIYLYNAYNFLYGPSGDEDTTFSQKFLMCIIAFLLNVVLLNLLISIMGDSYDRILEKRDKTDSLTRLEMMSEALTYMKVFRLNPETKKGYLVYCLSIDDSQEEENRQETEWEGRIHLIRKWLKQNDQKVEQMREITEKKINLLEQDMKISLDSLDKKIQSNQEFLKEMKRGLMKVQEDNHTLIRKIVKNEVGIDAKSINLH